VDTNGIITTFAGNGDYGYSGGGGPATQAELEYPSGVAVDAAGNVYIADSHNFRVRRVDTNGTIRRVAGIGNGDSGGDGGPATAADFYPYAIGLDSAGALFITDDYNNRVRKVDVSISAVDFASQKVGTVSPSQEVVVTNTGNQHIEFTGISLTGDFGQLTGTDRDCADTAAMGAGFSCALRITFAPTHVGTLTGSATATDNSLNLPGTKQPISLSGTAQVPVISADNLTSFQQRDVGTTSLAKTVRIKLNRALAISSIGIAAGSTEFAAGAVSGCVVDGHTVNPALSVCVIDVTFSPQYPGIRTAPLVVTDNAGIKSSFGLVGTGAGATGRAHAGHHHDHRRQWNARL
jgi:hypothetical protein